MSCTVEYYLAPQSPWAYLGHDRLAEIAATTGARIQLRPVDLGFRVFPVSGGLPLHQRAPQRQAYRLIELARYSSFLGKPLNLKPRFFPVNGDDASKLMIAVDQHDGVDTAMRFAGAVLAAVWLQERDIANEQVLAELLKECGLPIERLEQAYTQAAQQRYESYTQQAIDAGVFGAPTYVVEGELFWGQDRLDFVERKLRAIGAEAHERKETEHG